MGCTNRCPAGGVDYVLNEKRSETALYCLHLVVVVMLAIYLSLVDCICRCLFDDPVFTARPN